MIGRLGDVSPTTTGPAQAPSQASGYDLESYVPLISQVAGNVLQSQDPVQRVGVYKAELDQAILLGKSEKTIAELRAKYLAAKRAADVQVAWEAQQTRIGYLVELALGSAILLGLAWSASSLVRAARS